MAIKSWFGSRSGTEEEVPIDELIALRRFDEAAARLRERIAASPNDLHDRLKLADLLLEQGSRGEALKEYFTVADGHALEGFYSKAHALLAKLDRLLPGNDKVRQKMESLERVQNVERRRDLVVGALLQDRDERGMARSAFEVQRFWRDLAANPLVERMSDAQLRRLFGAFRMRKVEEGSILAAAGSATAEIYLIAAGEIAAQAVLSSGKRTTLRSFTPGDLIGDRVLLEHQSWPAEYVVTKSGAVLALTRESLGAAMQGETDPRGFLDALRCQRHDHEVASLVTKIFPGGERGPGS
ncbi:MAG: cyclic nucleotide-binding domain-containing protein [Thermoanaerobaculia bacterium]|nr:cyclic nucleotide-binding domain-containing protein [Thermoanaerobaculia bacterium]